MKAFDIYPSEISNHESRERSTIEAVATTEERKRKNSSSKSEIEFQRLKALVSIPYLPPSDTIPSLLPNGAALYTLVLDLDETLIHLECDEEGGDD